MKPWKKKKKNYVSLAEEEESMANMKKLHNPLLEMEAWNPCKWWVGGG